MKQRKGLLIVIGVILVFAALYINSCTHEPNFISDLETVCYEGQILPILQNSCGTTGCHNSASKEGGLDVSQFESVKAFVTDGSAKKSELYNVLTKIYGEDMMPPGKPLSKEERNLILVWIEQGANYSTCDTANIDDSVCFVQDVKPIIISNCAIVGCHDATTGEGGYIFNSYNNIMDDNEAVVPYAPNDSKIYEVINKTGEDRMPPSPMEPLTNEQKEIIRKWIADGALNSNCPSAVCDTSGSVSFAGIIWPAVDRSCVGCHNNTTLSGGVNLSNFTHIHSYATTLRNNTPILLGVTRHESGFEFMPPGGQFEDCTIRQLELWIEQGALDN